MELEKLLQPPMIEVQAARARALIVSIARSAPRGDIANRAMQVTSALYQAPPEGDDPGRGILLALARLRAALEDFAEVFMDALQEVNGRIAPAAASLRDRGVSLVATATGPVAARR